MVRRTKRTKKRKTTRPAPKRKKAVAKESQMSESKRIRTSNQIAQWVAYKELQDQVEEAWSHLQEAVRKRSSPKVLFRSRNELLLLLGECDYMARECMRIYGKPK